LFVALYLNRKFIFKPFIIGLIFFLWITPDSAIYNVWRFIFSIKAGLINKYLIDFHIINEPIIWLRGNSALFAIIIANIWKNWSLGALILLAGLKKIPMDLYESSRIDGLNILQRLININIPLLMPFIKIVIIILLINNFNAFNQFYVMLGGDSGAISAIPSLILLKYNFTYLQLGISLAMAIVLLSIIFISVYLLLKFKKEPL
jgi:multiple sugar transport system permease protein